MIRKIKLIFGMTNIMLVLMGIVFFQNSSEAKDISQDTIETLAMMSMLDLQMHNKKFPDHKYKYNIKEDFLLDKNILDETIENGIIAGFLKVCSAGKSYLDTEREGIFSDLYFKVADKNYIKNDSQRLFLMYNFNNAKQTVTSMIKKCTKEQDGNSFLKGSKRVGNFRRILKDD